MKKKKKDNRELPNRYKQTNHRKENIFNLISSSDSTNYNEDLLLSFSLNQQNLIRFVPTLLDEMINQYCSLAFVFFWTKYPFTQ